jgi:undecaprenyl diphosphate synthase
MIRAEIPASEVTDEVLASYLDTRGIPDPDLIIRTAGEMRLSNFLLWQAAYAEFYATETYWPDFDEAEIDKALAAYARRERRFGAIRPARQAATSNGHSKP